MDTQRFRFKAKKKYEEYFKLSQLTSIVSLSLLWVAIESFSFRALFPGSCIIGSLISQFQGSGCAQKEALSTWLLGVYLSTYVACSLQSKASF